ncbi:MAG: S-layer homology domain-containing protein [Clostridiaceae bacterium]|nr:S-layer homology domain-containing protein [Clostridiaceae bacterium]
MKQKPVAFAKNAVCILSCLCFLLTLLPTTEAVYNELTVSDSLVDIVKNYEGFSKYAINDGTGWYIGYGSSCGRYEYPSGITEEEADTLLRSMLSLCSDVINNFAKKNKLTFTQSQFDALACFTYNLGDKWIRNNSSLAQALKDGIESYTDLQVVNLFGVWCHFDSSPSKGLARRRIEEACIFLYGDYSGSETERYTYITLAADGGEVDTDVVFYEKNEPYGALPYATKSGHTLSGWKTSDGSILATTDIATGITSVKAVWGVGSAPSTTAPPATTTPAKVITTVMSTATVHPAATAGSFHDVSSGAWYYPYVRDLSATGVLSGYPDGSFRPDDQVTLGAALKLILRAAGFEEEDPINAHWASGYAAFAVMEGMVSASDVSNLNGSASRLLVAQIAAQSIGLEYSFGSTPFVDTTDGFVISLYQRGIISGFDVSGAMFYKPTSGITRAEICAIVWRIAHM